MKKETIVNDIMNLAIVLMVAALIFASAAIVSGQGVPKDSVTTVKLHTSVQCSGRNKSNGQQCKKMTKDLSGLCFMHNPKRKEEVRK